MGTMVIYGKIIGECNNTKYYKENPKTHKRTKHYDKNKEALYRVIGYTYCPLLNEEKASIRHHVQIIKLIEDLETSNYYQRCAEYQKQLNKLKPKKVKAIVKSRKRGMPNTEISPILIEE